MSLLVGFFLMLTILFILVPLHVTGVPLAAVFLIVWFILFVFERAGKLKLPY